MPARTSMSVLALVGGIILLSIPAAVFGTAMRFHPVTAGDNIICTPGEGACGETQIILSEGGVIVTLFLEISEWAWPGQDPNDMNYWLASFWATLDSSTLTGGHAGNPGTVDGVDLVPVGQPGMGFEGAYLALEVCTDDPDDPDMTDPITRYSFCRTYTPQPGSAPCPASHPDCVQRPDFIFAGLDHTPSVSTSTLDYFWGIGSVDCVPDLDGGQTKFYFGTLLLDVPPAATGTYNVNFLDDPNFTLWCLCPGCLLWGTELTPGQITIIPGASDCNGNGVPDESEPDTDGDGTIDGCDGCPNDPNKTEPGVCGCGVDDDPDADGDGIPDCVDECPGVDDDAFAPDCAVAIPTVSAWGLAVMTLLLLLLAKLYACRSRTQ